MSVALRVGDIDALKDGDALLDSSADRDSAGDDDGDADAHALPLSDADSECVP